jgi:DNA-binding phage protein
MNDRLHEQAMVEQLQADPRYAAELLTEVRRNGDTTELAILLRQMAKAFGRVDGCNLFDADRKLPPK